MRFVRNDEVEVGGRKELLVFVVEEPRLDGGDDDPSSVFTVQPSGSTHGFQMRKRSAETQICTGRAHGVVAMNEGVKDGLAQGGIGHGVALDGLAALISDRGLEVFGPHEVDDFGRLREQIAVQGIVAGEIGFGADETDFHEGRGDVFLRIVVKKQDSGAPEVGAFGELGSVTSGALEERRSARSSRPLVRASSRN